MLQCVLHRTPTGAPAGRRCGSCHQVAYPSWLSGAWAACPCSCSSRLWITHMMSHDSRTLSRPCFLTMKKKRTKPTTSTYPQSGGTDRGHRPCRSWYTTSCWRAQGSLALLTIRYSSWRPCCSRAKSSSNSLCWCASRIQATQASQLLYQMLNLLVG